MFEDCTTVVSRGRARSLLLALVEGGMIPNDSDGFVRTSRRQASDEEESFIFNSR